MATVTSDRNYLTIAELQDFANITVTDTDEAFDNISRAEEILDRYVGYQEKSIDRQYYGEVTSVNSKTIFDASSGTQLTPIDGFFSAGVIEIIGGTGKGQRRIIDSSSKDNKSITYIGDTFSPNVDTTSIFKIYQLAKFPRVCDRVANRNGTAYYKAIPDAVRRATAAQVAYMIAQGDAFFTGASSDMQSENIGDYGYNRGQASAASTSIIKLTAPMARSLLRGIKNPGGRIVSGPDAWG